MLVKQKHSFKGNLVISLHFKNVKIHIYQLDSM
jgi:hypothetical protein